MEKKSIDKILLKKMLIFFLALIGFLITIKLSFIYYESNFDAYALPSFCSINEIIDCDGVAQTIHSQFFGVPLALWGMFLYIFIMFLLLVDKIKKIKFLGFLEVFKNPLSYISALCFIAFAISMLLAGISIFEIKKICILCVATYFLDLMIATIATNFDDGIIAQFKTSVRDFIDALKVRKYLISFFLVCLLGSSVLAYTTFSCIFTPQVKRYEEFKKYEKLQSDNPFKVSGNLLGDKNPKFTVYIYTDYRCPICRVYNVMLQRAALELGGFKMVHKNLPLDNTCNSNLESQFHEGACLLSYYAIASEKQGRFWDFNSEMFEKEPKNEKDVLKLAEKMGLNTVKLKKDAMLPSTKKQVQNDISNSMDLKIDGTPTIVINGKVYTGIKPYYELKEILINAGAFEK